MSHHPIIVAGLLGIAVFLCLACSLGLVVVRDPFQRLHFSAPVTSVAIGLIVVAIWIADADWQARVKAALVGLVLFWMNAILAHATARAIRIREVGHWPLTADESVPLLDVGGTRVGNAAIENSSPRPATKKEGADKSAAPSQSGAHHRGDASGEGRP